jgi:glycosyltransferase involved in cell wall biosynthesis
VLFRSYAGHIDIFFAKILNLFRRRPVLLDAFLSLYDTAVMDRRIVSPGSMKAKLLWLMDRWSCRIADAVLLDTQAHVDYFVREFRLPAEKFHAIPVGSYLAPHDENTLPFKGRDKGGDGVFSGEHQREWKNRFTVLYFGSYIPLHGVDVILKAAKIIQDKGNGVLFTLVGIGQLLPAMKELALSLELKNVIFIDRFVREEELMGYIMEADICLGVFGQTDKAARVIPCKVYNCLAMGKPLVTASTLATEGVLTHRENAFLCRPGDPAALSEAILSLKNDKMLREKIAHNGLGYFKKNFSAEAIGKKVMDVIDTAARR